MASKISTEEEKRAKVGKDSTDRLQTKLIKKGRKTVDEVHKMDRQTLISAVVELRHADTSASCNVPAEDVKTYKQIKIKNLRTYKLTLGKYKEMFSTA